MNKIEKLIKELCPNGVEWKKLGEVCVHICSGGTPNSKNSAYYNGEIPWLRTQEIDFRDIYETGMTITQEGLDNSSAKWIPANCVIVAMYGATVGKIGINKIPLTTNQACCNLEINNQIALYKYVFYCLTSQYEYIKSLGEGSQTNINAQIVKNLSIPLPPLPIQTEIVRILDKFVEQQEQLERLIELRKKQYEYYREEMLKPKEGEVWETKTLGEIASKLASGATPTGGEDSYKSTGISLIRSQNVLDFNMSFVGLAHIDESQAEKLKNVEVKENDLLLNITGDSVARICKVDSSILPARVNQHIMIIRLTNSVDCNYILYSLIQAKNKLLQCAESNGGSRKALNKKNVSDFIVNIPSLSKQKEIAEFLDSFESSIATLTSALEASKRRYEYYRDEMMRF